MKHRRTFALLIILILGVMQLLLSQGTRDSIVPPRPIELKDILSWKRVVSFTLSNDGQWLAYKISPAEGDEEIYLRNTATKKELRFPAGDAQSSGGPAILFSENSQWVAFTIKPSAKEVKKLKKEKKPITTKLLLVNLATEKKTEIDKIRTFKFSGEASTWLAIHKPAGERQEKDKWDGSDLILLELASGSQLNIGNVSEFTFNKQGKWLAWIIDAQGKSGNGIQLRNMETGSVIALESDSATYKSLRWTEEGTGFSLLKGMEHKDYEEKLYSVIGFKDFSSSIPKKVVYDPSTDKNFPSGMSISANQTPQWSDDLSLMSFGIAELKKKEKKDGKDTSNAAAAKKSEESDKETANIVIWHWKDPRLQAQQQVEESRDKNFSFTSVYRVKENKFLRLATDEFRQVTIAPKQQWATGTDEREYELMSNLDGRDYKDIYVIDLQTGEKKLVMKKNRWSYSSSPDGTHYLYYDDGHFFTYEFSTGKSYKITEGVPTSFINTEDDHNVSKPPTRPMGWEKNGKSVLISDGWDIWNIPVHGGTSVNLTVDGRQNKIRYLNRYVLDPEEKGIDLSKPIYISMLGDRTKRGGIGRIEKGKPGVKLLLWDDAAFSGLQKAKNAEVYSYTRATFRDYPDYYLSDALLQNGLKVTEANPQQKNFYWSSGSKLLTYVSTKGDTLQAALYLPANFEEGKNYPTIVYIYEKLSNGLNNYTSPSANGFNKSVYTSNGYAILMPDITYKINDPGMSAVWCVLPALDAAIATGVVDKNRVAIHGHSWGGYQTAFLVTQTKAFKAAIAGAPLTNMISMYSLVYWNTGSANQSIFESSQGRFYGGYWDNLDSYMKNSPVYYAKNVTTPLLILHNDKDGAVDWTQGIEYYNTLRRLQKPVVMLQYKGENHGLREPANQKDYTVRMKEFFDHYLMDKPAPNWWTEGIPYLKLKDHLDERAGGKPKVPETTK
ncbi:MAG: prolyl oligopeptidase family serine peptidase [bacterium]